MTTYRRLLKKFEAVQYTGTNTLELYLFTDGKIDIENPRRVLLNTKRGIVIVDPYYYVIRVGKNSYNICDPITFESMCEECIPKETSTI